MRLTARGRLAAQAILVLLAVMLMVGVAAATRAAPESAPGRSAPGVVVVGSGDSLWTLADRHVPDRDRRWAIEEIRRLNHLTDSRIEVGQQLMLP